MAGSCQWYELETRRSGWSAVGRVPERHDEESDGRRPVDTQALEGQQRDSGGSIKLKAGPGDVVVCMKHRQYKWQSFLRFEGSSRALWGDKAFYDDLVAALAWLAILSVSMLLPTPTGPRSRRQVCSKPALWRRSSRLWSLRLISSHGSRGRLSLRLEPECGRGGQG